MAEETKAKKSRRWSVNPATARARCALRSRGRRSDEGITLVEVMIAFVILMITMVPIGYLLTSTVQASTTTRQRQAALQLADSWVETISNNLSTMVPERTDPDGTKYPVTGTQSPIPVPAGIETPGCSLPVGDPCPPEASLPALHSSLPPTTAWPR